MYLLPPFISSSFLFLSRLVSLALSFLFCHLVTLRSNCAHCLHFCLSLIIMLFRFLLLFLFFSLLFVCNCHLSTIAAVFACILVARKSREKNALAQLETVV